MMIEIENKADCTGCTACASVCPKDAIEMIKDEDGFKYPVVNKKKCIGCDLCVKVCPMLKKYENDDNKVQFYAAYNKNSDIKNESTSGGFFTALAEKIIERGGIVYGAAFDHDFNVIHCGAENKKDLAKFRSSKYVQSDLENIFREIKENIEKGRIVLLYYQYYKRDKIEKYKSEIQSLSFRKKTYGYNSSTMSIQFKNGKEYNRGHESDELIKAFLNGYCSKESCYHCHFKSFTTIGDFKIGDLWNLGKYLGSEFQDGTTLVICCSDKAKKLLNQIKDAIELKEINKKDAEFYNGNGNGSMILDTAYRPKERDSFLKDLRELGFKKVKSKYLKMTPKEYAKMKLKPILYKLKLLDKVKLRRK